MEVFTNCATIKGASLATPSTTSRISQNHLPPHTRKPLHLTTFQMAQAGTATLFSITVWRQTTGRVTRILNGIWDLTLVLLWWTPNSRNVTIPGALMPAHTVTGHHPVLANKTVKFTMSNVRQLNVSARHRRIRFARDRTQQRNCSLWCQYQIKKQVRCKCCN